MKKFSSLSLLTLSFFSIVFFACRSTNQPKKVLIYANGSPEKPVNIGISDFFSNIVHSKFIDTLNSQLEYNFVKGMTVSLNKDTTISLFYADTVIVSSGEISHISYSNQENIRVTGFYYDLQDSLASSYQNWIVFFLNKEDSIISNEKYIEKILSEKDSFVSKTIKSLCAKCQIYHADESSILNSLWEIKKLSLSYFYLGRIISKRDSLGILEGRLNYYKNKIDQQKVSVFSQRELGLLITSVARGLTGKSIVNIKSRAELVDYYNIVRQKFTKKSISYDYLISSLEVQAKKNNIKFQGRDLNSLKHDARKSIFKPYVQKKYTLANKDLKDSPADDKLYDTQFKSLDLKNIISSYAGNRS